MRLLAGLGLFLFAVFPSIVLAEGEATSSAAGGSVPALQEPKTELGGNTPVDPIPAENAEMATTSTSTPQGGASPRPAPSAAVVPTSNPNPSATSSTPVLATSTPTTPSEESFPYLALMALIGVAVGAAFGALKMIGASTQNKSPGSCEDIKKQLEGKKNEQSALDVEMRGQESALELAKRKLQEKAEEKIDEKKNALVKKVKDETKKRIFGTQGASREGVDTAESAYSTYKDLEEKYEQAKKLLALLSSKRDGLSKEIQSLESSYAVCVSAVSGSKLLKKDVGGGIDLPLVSAPKALIFDWGGVVMPEMLWNWIRKNIPNPEQERPRLQAIIDNENIGSITPDGLVDAFAKASGKSPEMVVSELKAEQIVNKDLVALIQQLKKKYKIGLLSNASSHLRVIISDNKLDTLFDAVLISSEHKMIKPDPEIYRKMLDMFQLDASEAVFIDDRQKNVDGANAVGMRGILFTGTEQCIKDLKKLGISV